MVGDNEPYAVSDATDYTIPVHGEARGLMNSGIEIRQDLIADVSGEMQWAERLARIFREVRVSLAEHPEMQRDREKLLKVCCAVQMPVQLRRAPRPMGLAAW